LIHPPQTPLYIIKTLYDWFCIPVSGLLAWCFEMKHGKAQFPDMEPVTVLQQNTCTCNIQKYSNVYIVPSFAIQLAHTFWPLLLVIKSSGQTSLPNMTSSFRYRNLRERPGILEHRKTHIKQQSSNTCFEELLVPIQFKYFSICGEFI
jgi:hypothetical protein